MQNQLRRDVEALVAPGTRKVGTSGHDLAKTYIIERMNEMDLEPYRDNSFELPYQVESTDYVNLAGILPGFDRSLSPLQVVAHYDTCGDQPGADDNAAAIATWFAVHQLLKQEQLQRDIIFLFPDAEEPPRFLTEHMGSTNFFEKQLKGGLHAGLVLDLVGHDVPMPGMEDLLFIFGSESHRSLAELLLKTGTPAGLRSIATLNQYVGDLSDHHILRKNKQPYLFFTCGRWEHYHQGTDQPEHLNYTKMNRIVEYLTSLVKHLDQTVFEEDGFYQESVDMELDLINRALGPYLKQAGIPMNSREDIQRFVLKWVNQYQL